MGRIREILRRIAHRVWFRAALMTLGGIVLALLAGMLGAWIPESVSVEVGQGSVSSILQIIASSMLAVSTFSLTVMVTAYSSAATSGTPRATQLLVADRTSQNILSLFVGSFVFALVGIVALSTGYYNENGRTILFLGTLVVIVLIVIALLRWINQLSRFGLLPDTIDRIERSTLAVMREYAARPAMGAVPFDDLPRRVEFSAVHATSIGYVTHVDIAALQRIAEAADTAIYVAATPGRQADARVPLAYIPADHAREWGDAVRRAFLVENHRTFDQDPRFGIIALTEIGVRALSPAISDPGTAIEIIAALERVFGAIGAVDGRAGPEYDRVHVRETRLSELIEDGFRPLARDGAGYIEVQVRLQKTLSALSSMGDATWARMFRDSANDAARRAEAGLDRADRRVLRSVRRECW